MWDTKKQVKAAATSAMKSACEVIGNKDIEHMTDKIITAITKPSVPDSALSWSVISRLISCSDSA